MSRHHGICGTALVLTAGLLARVARGQQVDGNNEILYPDATGLTYNYLDTLDVALTTDYDTPYLYLYCWDASGDRQEIIYYSPSAVEGSSQVPVKLQSNTQYTGTTCWFNLLDAQSGSNTTGGATSPEFSETFSLSSTPSSTATSSASVTSSTATTTSTTSSVTSSSNTVSTPTTTAASSSLESVSSSNGLSRGAQAGIGVAVTLVALAILGAVIWLLMRCRRNGKTPSSNSEMELSPPGELEDKKYPAEIGSLERHELSSATPPHEMETPWQHLVLSELESPASPPSYGHANNIGH
ncbi:transmembrane alpha-helix domain-containing protein [Seiridium cupressi]